MSSPWWSSLTNGFDVIMQPVLNDTGLSDLETAVSNWWNGAPGSPLAPLGAKTYVGAVGAGLSADATAVKHVATGAVKVGSAVGSGVTDLASLTTGSMGPLIVVLMVIVIAVLVIKL